MPDDLILTKRAQLGRQLRVGLRRAFGRTGRPPELLILGAQKAGTTSLYKLLTEHQNIVGALTKEVHYFSWNYHQPWAWYLAHFPQRDAATTAVEASPDYLFHPLAQRRITERFQEVKCIVLLRDPAERALSHYFHSRRLGEETREIETALFQSSRQVARDAERIERQEIQRSRPFEHHSYLERGHYASQLQRLRSFLPEQQTQVLFLEDLRQPSSGALAELYRFIDLPMSPTRRFERHHPGRYQRTDPDLFTRLRDHFEPHDRELEELLKCEIPWRSKANSP